MRTWPPISGNATSVRLLLTDATLYDPNARLTSVSQATNGTITAVLTGGWAASDDPGVSPTWVWPLKNIAGSTPAALARWAVRTLLSERDVPALKSIGDTWVMMGICTLGNPSDAAWNARASGWRYSSTLGARRIRMISVVNGAAPTLAESSGANTTLRQISETWQRYGTSQILYPICSIALDGSGSPTGTNVTTTNSVLTLGQGQELGIFLSIGRSNASEAQADTVYIQADTEEIVEWKAGIGTMDASRKLNLCCMGDSLTQGTGWNYLTSGELFGWREKLARQWISTGVLPTLRYHGNVTSTVGNAVMTLGRFVHDGRSGFTSANYVAAVGGYLTGLADACDVFIISLGGNDAQTAVPTATYIANMQGIIDAIRAHANFAVDAKILVAKPPPLTNVTHEATFAGYRTAIPTLTGVDGFIDDTEGFVPATHHAADGVHLNEAGYELLATKRMAAIRLARGL